MSAPVLTAREMSALTEIKGWKGGHHVPYIYRQRSMELLEAKELVRRAEKIGTLQAWEITELGRKIKT